MRDYLTRGEIELTGIIFISKEYMRTYLEKDCVTDEERRKLELAIKHLDFFQESMLSRLDKVYLKRLKGFLDNNDFKPTPKGLNRNEIVEFVDDEIMEKLLEDSQWKLDCIDCERCDYQNCDCYKVLASVKPTIKNTSGCPFK